MRKEELETLLKKFYTGTTTRDDEEALRKYFTSPDVPTGYEAEKAIFSYFIAVPEPSHDFTERISKGIDASMKRTFRRAIYSAVAAAAMIILLISLIFFIKLQNRSEDTFDDPQIAYSETLKILYSISAQLNRGREALEPVSKIGDVNMQGLSVFNNSMKTLQREMRNLQPLNDAILLVDTTAKNKNN